MEAGSLYYDLEITDNKLSGQLKDSEAKVQGFGEKLQGSFRDASKVLAGVGAGLTLFAKNATDFTTQSVKDSKALGQQIGVTTTEASRLVAAFGRMGIEATSASQMFGIFSKKIVESTANSVDNKLAVERLRIEIDQTKKSIAETTEKIRTQGDASGELGLKLQELNNTLAKQENALSKSADAFAKLGVSTVDANGKQKDFNTLLFEVADKFKEMPNGIDKSALAMELFGRQGKEMIKVLNLGSSGIKDLEVQADKLGLTLNAKTIGAISDLVKSQRDLKQQTDALKIAVGTATAPVLTEFNKQLNNMVAALVGAPGPIKDITTNVLAFGGPVSAGAAAIAGFAGNLGGAIPLAKGLGLSLAGIGAALGWVGLVALVITALVLLEQQFHFVEAAIKFLQPAINETVRLFQLIYLFLQTYIFPIFQQIGLYIMSQLVPAWLSLLDSINQISTALEPFISKGDQLKIIIFALLIPFMLATAAVIGFIAIIALVVAAIATMINWVSQAINIYMQFSASVIGAMSAFIGMVAGSINQAIGWFNSLVGFVRGAIGGFVNAIVGGVNQAMGAIQSIPGRAMGALAGLPGAFYSAGVSMIQGLINGIKAMASGPANAVSGILSKVKSLLPHSPAKEGPLSGKGWTLYSGMSIVEGLAEGIKKSAGSAYASMDGVLSSLSGGANIPLAYSGGGSFGAGTMVNGATSGAGGATNINIGTINDKSDADYILRRSARNYELELKGGAPIL